MGRESSGVSMTTSTLRSPMRRSSRPRKRSLHCHSRTVSSACRCGGRISRPISPPRLRSSTREPNNHTSDGSPKTSDAVLRMALSCSVVSLMSMESGFNRVPIVTPRSPRVRLGFRNSQPHTLAFDSAMLLQDPQPSLAVGAVQQCFARVFRQTQQPVDHPEQFQYILTTPTSPVQALGQC